MIRKTNLRSPPPIPSIKNLVELLLELPDPLGQLLGRGNRRAVVGGRDRGAQVGRGDDLVVVFVAPVDPILDTMRAVLWIDTLVGDVSAGGGPPRAHAVLARQFPVAPHFSAATGDARQGWAAATLLGGSV